MWRQLLIPENFTQYMLDFPQSMRSIHTLRENALLSPIYANYILYCMFTVGILELNSYTVHTALNRYSTERMPIWLLLRYLLTSKSQWQCKNLFKEPLTNFKLEIAMSQPLEEPVMARRRWFGQPCYKLLIEYVLLCLKGWTFSHGSCPVFLINEVPELLYENNTTKINFVVVNEVFCEHLTYW
jgi:hypothetical protein